MIIPYSVTSACGLKRRQYDVHYGFCIMLHVWIHLDFYFSNSLIPSAVTYCSRLDGMRIETGKRNSHYRLPPGFFRFKSHPVRPTLVSAVRFRSCTVPLFRDYPPSLQLNTHDSRVGSPICWTSIETVTWPQKDGEWIHAFVNQSLWARFEL